MKVHASQEGRLSKDDELISDWIRLVVDRLATRHLSGKIRLADKTDSQPVSARVLKTARKRLQREHGAGYFELEALHTVLHDWINKLKEGIYKIVERENAKE